MDIRIIKDNKGENAGVFLPYADWKVLKLLHQDLAALEAGSNRALNTIQPEWWENEVFVYELDARYEAMESGNDPGIKIDELKNSIEIRKQDFYGK